MATTVVGVFDEFSQAQQAVRELTDMGIGQGNVSIARNEPSGQGYTTYGGANSKDYTTGTSVGEKISNFFGSVFGSDDDADERDLYAESVRRGSTVVVVNTDDSNVDRVTDVLNRAGAIDVDRRAAQYRAAGYQKFDQTATPYSAEQTATERQSFADQGEIALPVIEEQLAVGKRVVQRGGVRVHTRVTERPVEESVTLREENVHVERRPVNRTASEADFANVQEGEFTLTERAEEAVIGKQARVVEEVVVGKNVTEHEETIRETVRRTDVEVEETDIDTDATRGTTNR